jgi:DNA mismatch repair protein MSH6
VDGDDDDEESPKQSTKKRRRVIQEEESEEEFEFDGDVGDDEDDGEYEVENEANEDEEQGDWLVSDDDNASEKPKKGVSKSKSNKRLKVVEHDNAAASLSSSAAATVSPKGNSTTTPATATTPKSLASFSAFSASKSSAAPNRVTPPASTRAGASPLATDELEKIGDGVKALPYVRDAPNPPGSHVHNHLEFLRNPKDANGRSPGEPGYSPRTLKVDFKELQRHYNPPGNKSKPLSPGVQQWWEMKAQYYDTVLLFKTGKFYEIFNEDCDIAVSVLGLQYMKGHIAHCGFPEISYGPMADKLARAGYKVARVEQTETPEDLAKRKKKTPKGSANPKVVNREVCSILTMGTRTFCYLDCELASDFSPETTGNGPLLAIKEVLLEQEADQVDSDTVEPTCEYGIVVVDAARASITLGQFADDVLRSRMSTLLHTFNPSEILVEGGENGASPVLRALLKSNQMSSSTKFRVEDILPTESYPKSTAIDPKARQFLERKNGKVEPWNVQETLEELHRRKYFPSASKEDKKSQSTSRWPQVLRLAVEGNAELALSSFGAALYYLQRNLIDHDILSMGLVHAYVPPASPIVETPNELSNTPGEVNDGPGPDNSSMTLVGAHGNEADITHMSIDGNTLVQLDVLLNSLDNKSAGSLAHLIDSTKSPGGSRVLVGCVARISILLYSAIVNLTNSLFCRELGSCDLCSARLILFAERMQ